MESISPLRLNLALVEVKQQLSVFHSFEKPLVVCPLPAKKDPKGGKAWSFYSTLQIMLRVGKEKGKVWDGMQGKAVDSILGTCVRAKLDKCKVSDSAHGEVDFYLISGEGVDNVRTVIELAIKSGVISKKGAWFSWNGGDGEIRSQGLNSFKVFVRGSR